MLSGLIIGLSNGATCLASCAPVILPYMLGSGESVARNAVDLSLFLAGRLAGYISFAIHYLSKGVLGLGGL